MNTEITPDHAFPVGSKHVTVHGETVRVHAVGEGSRGTSITYSKSGNGTEIKFTVLESYFASIVNG